MFASERHNRILALLAENGTVKISDLTKLFSVSIETIRRDLLTLEKQNCLQRVHGGAIKVPVREEYVVKSKRMEKNHELKTQLVQYAAELIREKDTIMVDCGSTAIEFAGMLAEHFEELTVITNSLDVFDVLRSKERYTVYLCSGFFMREENAFYGPWVLEHLDQFHAKTSFLFPSAISLQYGIMDHVQELYFVQKKMMTQSDNIVFCADSNKFEKSGLLKLADLKEGCTLVTDSCLQDDIFRLYHENHIRIYGGKKQ